MTSFQVFTSKKAVLVAGKGCACQGTNVEQGRDSPLELVPH